MNVVKVYLMCVYRLAQIMHLETITSWNYYNSWNCWNEEPNKK